ncbi:hypothetical protein PFICI_15326 [Pestalotiopsis fici W106-1]|uniref:Uncharacterized protein n=1 Tax=Pestalotiopsis fici (strain W106-1 / CGMCC3.15140) TaxID=1229662 RepID=W3WGK2_PESFW|nr:uncharacterized protein PFICI_15326 [Pestalotiopsis fici W106-1]ETS72934.1 hypothetical protein PFICI_15326 [Pestalotiopsis fici W106-1]
MGHAKEADQLSLPGDAAPPPAYSEAVASTPQESLEQPQQSDLTSIRPTTQVPQQFPASFNAYYQWKFTKTFHLGESKDHPLYAVRTHSGWSGNPGIVLHNGPSDQDPPLAAAGQENQWSRHSFIILPPLPGSSAESSTEFMRTNVGWKNTSQEFSIEVGIGDNLKREKFEWRQSHGSEIKQLGKCTRGWKLVRVSAEAAGPGGERNERAPGASSDGKEIVAVWAFYAGWSMTKSFKFQFLGSGLTGELGERWSVMAVITALRMWYMHFQGSTATTTLTTTTC